MVWKRIARWRFRRKQIARKMWMSERSTDRDSCETLKSLRTWSRCSATGRRKVGRKCCKSLRGGGQNFCRSTEAARTRRGITSKEAAQCEEEMRMLNEENEGGQARFQARFQTLSEKSGKCRREANNLEEKIQGFAGRRGKKRQLCVRVQRMLL